MATYKNFFKPLHPEKYKGDPKCIIYRSRWEAVMMSNLDKDPNVISWSSEEVAIPYRDPFDITRIRRYFPDFIVEKRMPNGKIKKIMIEIKPFHQTQLPAKKSKKLLKEQEVFIINKAKWEAAKAFCKNNDMSFEIITEKDYNFTFGKK